MAMTNAFRACASKFLASKPGYVANRGFHATATKRGGGHGHGHGHGDGTHYDYEHAPHMYSLERMSNQRLKMTLFVWSLVSMGVAIPVWAVSFQQKKAKSG